MTKLSALMKTDLGSVLRFGVIGLAQNGVSFLLVMAAVQAGLAPWQAFALVFPVAVAATYWMNANWTFRDRQKRKAAPLAYALVYCTAYGLSLVVSFVLETAGLHSGANALLTIGLVGVYTFLMLDRGVFG